MLAYDFAKFPMLTTGRLVLRQLKKKDANEIRALRSNPVVNEFIDRKGTITISEASAFIEMINMGIKNNEWIYWAITLKDNDRLIGTICYWNFLPEKEMAEVGYELHPDFHGKGMMQEAIATVIHWGFQTMNLYTITALPGKENRKSIRVLLRNGFKIDEYNDYVSKPSAGGVEVYYLNRPK